MSVLLYLPTYCPWLKLIELLWQAIRYAVTHYDFFTSFAALEAAFLDYVATLPPNTVCTISGAKPK